LFISSFSNTAMNTGISLLKHYDRQK
jgi:hypothetical protein